MYHSVAGACVCVCVCVVCVCVCVCVSACIVNNTVMFHVTNSFVRQTVYLTVFLAFDVMVR